MICDTQKEYEIWPTFWAMKDLLAQVVEKHGAEIIPRIAFDLMSVVYLNMDRSYEFDEAIRDVGRMWSATLIWDKYESQARDAGAYEPETKAR